MGQVPLRPLLLRLFLGDILLNFLNERARRLDAGRYLCLGNLKITIVVSFLAQGLHLRVERTFVDGEYACADIILVEADGSTLVRANLTSIKDKHGTHGVK